MRVVRSPGGFVIHRSFSNGLVHSGTPIETGADKVTATMSKTIINFWLDTLLLVVFTTLVAVSAVVRFVFPPGTGAEGWLLWGMTYDDWCDVRFGILSVLGGAILLHVMLHWSWVCGVIWSRLLRKKTRPDDGARTIYGVAVLIVLLHLIGAVFVAAMFTIESPEDRRLRDRTGLQEPRAIRMHAEIQGSGSHCWQCCRTRQAVAAANNELGRSRTFTV